MTDQARIKANQRAARWRSKNPERVKEISRRGSEKRRNDPEKIIQIRAYQKSYRAENRKVLQDKERQRRFGITRNEYAELFHKQNGKCAICQREETATRNGTVKSLAVDHCHSSGKIRGLLCADCNTGIGKLKDDVKILQNAIQYLSNPKEGSVI